MFGWNCRSIGLINMGAGTSRTFAQISVWVVEELFSKSIYPEIDRFDMVCIERAALIAEIAVEL
jgi:hypothetical protein